MTKVKNAVSFTGLLLRKQSPDLARNRSLLTVHADDKDFPFCSNERGDMPVQKLRQ
jgi:hypothetical protein